MGRKRKAETIADACDKLWKYAEKAGRTVVNGLPGSAEIIARCQRLTDDDIDFLRSRGYGVGQGRIRSRGRFLLLNEPKNTETGVTEADKAVYKNIKK